jgi:hypothetical protein
MNLQDVLALLKSANNADEINEKREEIAAVIPTIRIMFDYDQQNNAHKYDLWMHCVHTVVNLPRNMDDDMVYLAALMHDIGKPKSQCRGKREDDEDMHYYGHPVISKNIVENEVIPALARQGDLLLQDDARRLCYYVEYHDDRVSLKIKHLKSHLQMVSFEEFRKLMLLEVADAMAHVQLPIIANRVEICSALAGEYGEELYNNLKNE